MQTTKDSGIFSQLFAGQIIVIEECEFIARIMKLNPRDRPSAKELLLDVWFDKS